jgi:hypothetical protein
MSEDLFNGKPSTEAMHRISAWSNQKSEEHPRVSRPSATNNRGHVGHHESHAYGDMVGQENNNMPNNNMQQPQRQMQNQNNEMHADGGEVGNGALPSQGGCHQKAPYGNRGNSNLPSQGGSRGMPMSGHMEAPRNKYGRQNHAMGENVRDDEREGHSFGSFVRGAAKSAGNGIKSAARTVGNDVKKGVGEIGSHVKNAAKEAAPIIKQGAHDVYSGVKKEVGNTARNVAKNGAKNLMAYASRAATEAPMAAKRGGNINR